MKVRFYVDVYPGCDIRNATLFACNSPIAKPRGVKRLAFDVAIPVSMLTEVDAESPEVSIPMLVPDHDANAVG